MIQQLEAMKLIRWQSMGARDGYGHYRLFVQTPNDGGRLADIRARVHRGEWEVELVNGNYRNEEADEIRELGVKAVTE